MNIDREFKKALRDRLIEVYGIDESELDSYEAAISAHAITSMQTEQPVKRFGLSNKQMRIIEFANGDYVKYDDYIKAVSTNTDGWVSVPIEPTEEMIRAGLNCWDSSDLPHEVDIVSTYKAMINAISQDKGESV